MARDGLLPSLSGRIGTTKVRLAKVARTSSGRSIASARRCRPPRPKARRRRRRGPFPMPMAMRRDADGGVGDDHAGECRGGHGAGRRRRTTARRRRRWRSPRRLRLTLGSRWGSPSRSIRRHGGEPGANSHRFAFHAEAQLWDWHRCEAVADRSERKRFGALPCQSRIRYGATTPERASVAGSKWPRPDGSGDAWPRPLFF